MENVEMETFNDNIDLEERTQEETSFFENAFDDNMDYDMEYDDDLFDNLNFDERMEKILETERKIELQNNEHLDHREKYKHVNKVDRQKRITITYNRKRFFRNALKQKVTKKDGPESKELIKESFLSENKRTGRIDGIFYKDVKVIVWKKGKFTFSENEKSLGKVKEFRELMEKARLEHAKTANGFIENTADILPNNTDEVRKSVIEDVVDTAMFTRDNLDETTLTEQEFREFTGILHSKNIKFVDMEVTHWEDKAKEETSEKRKVVYQDLSDVAKLKADELRMEENLKPKYLETKEIIESNELTKFEKFKKFSKNNLGALSAVGIGIAGIITTVLLTGKKGLITAAKATGALAKATAKLGKAALPILVPLVNVLVTALSWGAKGLAWLSKNLWMIAIALSYILYTRIQQRFAKK